MEVKIPPSSSWTSRAMRRRSSSRRSCRWEVSRASSCLDWRIWARARLRRERLIRISTTPVAAASFLPSGRISRSKLVFGLKPGSAMSWVAHGSIPASTCRTRASSSRSGKSEKWLRPTQSSGFRPAARA